MPAHPMRFAYRSVNGTSQALVVNTFHLEVATLTDPPNYTTICSDVDTWLTTLYRAILWTGFTLLDLTATEEDYPGAVPGQGIKPINLAGTRTASDALEANGLTQVVTLLTNTPKRYARGRMFMPSPINSTALASGGNFLQSGLYWTGITAFMNALVAGHTAGSTDYTPAVYSKSQADRGETPYLFPVTGYIQRPTPHWLRSRMTTP